MESRDERIDLLRGAAMIWVVLIHCLYQTSLVPDGLTIAKSYLLVEMPILFFVAGAAAALSRRRGPTEYYASRLSRILIPFWVYGALCLVHALASAGEAPGTYAMVDWVRWVVPYQLPRTDTPFLAWHLWFVRVYLAVIVLVPGLVWVRSRLAALPSALPLQWVPLPLLGIGVLVCDRLTRAGISVGELTPYLLFYGFWLYLGLGYLQLRAARPTQMALAVGALFGFGATFLLVRFGGYSADMQTNKFPPNFAFLVLQCAYFCCYGLAWGRATALLASPRIRALVLTYSRYSYTIYLYHAFSFLALQTLFRSLGLEEQLVNMPWVGLPVYVVLVVASGLFWARTFGWIEDWSSALFRSTDAVERLRRSRKTKLGFALAAALLLFGVFQERYQSIDYSLQQSPAFFRFNVIFGSDIPRVIDDITNAGANHYRTKVHPLFVLLTNGEGSRLAQEMGSAPAAAAKVTAVVGAACVSLMLAYLMLLGCGLPEALLVAILFAYSASQMMWSSVPETFVFGTAALLVMHCLGVLALRLPPRRRVWALLALPAAGVLALGTTTTNAIQALVVLCVVAWSLVRPEPRHSFTWSRVPLGLAWLAVAVLITLTVAVKLSDTQKELYPSSVQFYLREAYEEERLYTHWDNLKRPAATAGTLGRVFGLYSVIAPPPNLISVQEPPDTTAIVFQDDCANKYSPANWLALSVWGSLLAYGLYAGWKTSRRLLVILVICIAANFGIHSVYGTDEAFLYSGHIVFLLFGVVGLGLAQLRLRSWAWRTPIILALSLLVWHVATTNTAFMDRIGLILTAL